MVKLVSPMFGTSARGTLGDLGFFRNTPHGPQLVEGETPAYSGTPQQLALRACFAEAKAAHSAIHPRRVYYNGKWRVIRLPIWPDFWAQWLIDHPDCRT